MGSEWGLAVVMNVDMSGHDGHGHDENDYGWMRYFGCAPRVFWERWCCADSNVLTALPMYDFASAQSLNEA